ncbi:MAG TPA: nickel pincer cofactor biosynthesis protein LarB [Candidatus Blautia gallistercoris]|uniref:Nickel pincer cofactor biosynthesis protein LarB n=1 Tax=Candidatus Blautia gallistercoris TaxID=2838490 RepID=A0A9D1WI56_9FIRM|nr:nickel pincer cofactor biosynthesis protein LarB [Candidatus Blautia gallistercoris]
MELDHLLSLVQQGKMDIEQAKDHLKTLPYEDLGFAKLDHHRKLRSGYGEVIYCAGKTIEHMVKIYQSFYEKGTNVLGTRATPEQAAALQKVLPDAQYDPLSRILQVIQKPVEQIGCVAVCTGGTSDMAVAEEAALTAEFLGAKVERIYDVGVAGIHRLLSKTSDLRHANCIVAVAGMEGALGGVVAGLVDKPVIAVPTSVGYGASFHGLSALLTMLNSCAEGISVVNIDNGFGAGYNAAQINRLAVH